MFHMDLEKKMYSRVEYGQLTYIGQLGQVFFRIFCISAIFFIFGPLLKDTFQIVQIFL